MRAASIDVAGDVAAWLDGLEARGIAIALGSTGQTIAVWPDTLTLAERAFVGDHRPEILAALDGRRPRHHLPLVVRYQDRTSRPFDPRGWLEPSRAY
jgi:hypothetical protein